MFTSRLEIRIDPVMRGWLQQISLQTGMSQGEIIREAIAQVQIKQPNTTAA